MDVVKCFNIPDRRLTSGDLGVEVEVEGSSLPRRMGQYWNIDYDGSLKGEAYEYVLDKPLSEADVGKALAYLGDKYKECNTTVNDSVRCGVHIHVNVQKLSIVQLYNFITLYSMFEGVLLDYCGKGRNGNLFCLPLNRSVGVIQALRATAQQNYFRGLHDDEYRYCALNVKSLGQYGSVEFRALRGGPDLSRISDWSSLLLHLRDVACTYPDPTCIIENGSMVGCVELFSNVCEPFMHMFDLTKNLERKLQDGIQSAQAIAFSCDWEVYNREVDPYEDFC